MNKLLLLSVTLVILASCTSKYSIKGNASLSQLSGKTIYLKYIDDASLWVTIDSAQIVHGEFCMKGKTFKKPQMVTLFMDSTPITPLILESGHINISLSSSNLSIQGTRLNNKLYSFYEENQAIERRIKENSNDPCEDIYHTVVTAHQSLIKEFMCINQHNILGPTIYSIYHDQYPELFKNDDFKMAINDLSSSMHDPQIVHQSISIEHFKESYPEGFLLW